MVGSAWPSPRLELEADFQLTGARKCAVRRREPCLGGAEGGRSKPCNVKVATGILRQAVDKEDQPLWVGAGELLEPDPKPFPTKMGQNVRLSM